VQLVVVAGGRESERADWPGACGPAPAAQHGDGGAGQLGDPVLAVLCRSVGNAESRLPLTALLVLWLRYMFLSPPPDSA
jgi:hypothetical protein